MLNLFRAFTHKLLGAIVFYTQIPLSHSLPLDFDGIARFAPIVGLLLAWLLGVPMGILSDLTAWGLRMVFSSSVIAAVTIALWVWITGAMHLDGAMDLADGLAVPDRDRRLEVMRDSRTGAFGAVVAILLLLLKFSALTSLLSTTPSLMEVVMMLMLVCGWARWAPMIAIARYPYLRDRQGKGYLHQKAVLSFWDALPSALILLGVGMVGVELGVLDWDQWVIFPIVTLFFGWGFSHWIAHQLGGHTGDSYGAIVEWTEVLLLCLMSGF